MNSLICACENINRNEHGKTTRILVLRTLYIHFFPNGESTEEKDQLPKKFTTVLPVEVASGSDHSQK